MKCCDYTVGMMKHQVSFQRVQMVSDDAGGVVEQSRAYRPLARAHITQASGSERFFTDRVEAISSYKVVVRYFADLRESDTIVFQGRAHNITRINNVEFANKWVEINVNGGVPV